MYKYFKHYTVILDNNRIHNVIQNHQAADKKGKYFL